MTDVKPTPTQAENDAAAMGQHVMEKEPDGSPADPGQNPPDVDGVVKTRAIEAEKPPASTAYQTRTVKPATPKS
jgi:hypothetical protein